MDGQIKIVVHSGPGELGSRPLYIAAKWLKTVREAS